MPTLYIFCQYLVRNDVNASICGLYLASARFQCFLFYCLHRSADARREAKTLNRRFNYALVKADV